MAGLEALLASGPFVLQPAAEAAWLPVISRKRGAASDLLHGDYQPASTHAARGSSGIEVASKEGSEHQH